MHSVPPFFAAPHRVMFLAGATNAVLAVAWWSLVLALRIAENPLASAWSLPPSWAHGALMIFGVFPFFIFGFALTAGPRWQGYGEVKGQVFVPAFAAMSAGWLLFYVSLLHASLLPMALAMVLVGWLVGLREVWRIALHPNPDNLHIRILAAAMSVGALGLALLVAQVSGGPGTLAVWALSLGVWGFLLPVYATVGHRMIPFFTASALPGYRTVQPQWALLLIAGGGLIHGILGATDLAPWAWLADLPGAGAAIYLSASWQMKRTLEVRMLAMLHVGFAWLGLGLSLSVLQGLLGLVGIAALGLAPLHALTVGFFTSILIGMASRVVLGHSGLPMKADLLAWAIFQGIQLTALLRVVADLVPGGANHAYLLASLGWVTVFVLWWQKYCPLLWRPRADGKPG